MGTATALNFQPTGNGKAAITGDFVLIAEEVNPVIRVLQSNGVTVTALHSHMLTESPRLFFMHFWANDDAVRLAHALNETLAKTNSAKSRLLKSRAKTSRATRSRSAHRRTRYARNVYQVQSTFPAGAPKFLAQGQER